MAWYNTILPTSPESSTYADLPEDQDNWSCDQWIAYYNRNKEKLGQAEAENIIRNDMTRGTIWSDSRFCTYDCSFVDFFEKEFGENVGNIFSDIYCAGEELSGGVKELSAGAHSGITVLKNLIPIGVAVGAVFVGKWAYDNYIK